MAILCFLTVLMILLVVKHDFSKPIMILLLLHKVYQAISFTEQPVEGGTCKDGCAPGQQCVISDRTQACTKCSTGLYSADGLECIRELGYTIITLRLSMTYLFAFTLKELFFSRSLIQLF